MKLLDEPKVTVGQIVKDLERIVKKNPEAIPTYGGAITSYISGIRFLKKGLLLLEESEDEDDALTARGLLGELREMPKDSKVVLQYFGWQMRNLLPDEDGIVFGCDDEDEYINLEMSESDIRLRSFTQWYKEIKRLTEKCSDRKIVCWDEHGDAYYFEEFVDEEDDDDRLYFTAQETDGEEVDFTVGSFLGGDRIGGGCGVCVCYSEDGEDYYFKAVDIGEDGNIFFEDKVGDEDVIACRLGDTIAQVGEYEFIYDDEEEEEEEDDDDDDDEDDDDWDEEDDEEDEEEAAKKDDAKSDDVVEEEVAQEPETEPTPKQEKEPEQVTQADESDKGDIILKLVSYSGSVIKMMTTLSGIDGIDEEAAFDILQKLPSVVREGISAKTAMKIGAILEDAGATIELARASKPVAEEEPPKPVLVEPEPKPKPEPNPKPKPKPKPEQPKRPRMEYVDLGLSVKWAKWNLGASAPEEVGDYYSWGELSPKPHYVLGNYKFMEDWKTLTKYNTKESYGKVDNVKQLELSDDAAYQILGGGWRMPTAKEAKELEDNCSWERMTIKGVEGWKYKSKIKGYTDKWIFFPDTGHKAYDMLCAPDEGFYWTSSLYTRRPDCGLTLFCNSIYEGKVDRFDGMCIRPVTK